MNNTIYPFSVVDYPSNGKLFGKYYATKPLIAAKKAFKKLAQKYNIINTNNNYQTYIGGVVGYNFGTIGDSTGSKINNITYNFIMR